MKYGNAEDCYNFACYVDGADIPALYNRFVRIYSIYDKNNIGMAQIFERILKDMNSNKKTKKDNKTPNKNIELEK